MTGCPHSIRKFRMGMCSHQPGDPPATYIYKVKIKNYCTQLILMSMACLPLVYIVPRVVFKARFHTVTRVEVLTKPIDLSKGVNNLNLNGMVRSYLIHCRNTFRLQKINPTIRPPLPLPLFPLFPCLSSPLII